MSMKGGKGQGFSQTRIPTKKCRKHNGSKLMGRTWMETIFTQSQSISLCQLLITTGKIISHVITVVKLSKRPFNKGIQVNITSFVTNQYHVPLGMMHQECTASLPWCSHHRVKLWRNIRLIQVERLSTK